jgi:hypothetical protein
MAKYRVGIVFEYETDSNGYFDWEDEYKIEGVEPRSQSELLELTKREFLEVIEQQDVSDMVSIEEVK